MRYVQYSHKLWYYKFIIYNNRLWRQDYNSFSDVSICFYCLCSWIMVTFLLYNYVSSCFFFQLWFPYNPFNRRWSKKFVLVCKVEEVKIQIEWTKNLHAFLFLPKSIDNPSIESNLCTCNIFDRSKEYWFSAMPFLLALNQ
jgi:hypothetical protein